MVKNPPAMWETWIQSLSWEDPPEEGWQSTPVFLPRESPQAEELGGLQYSPWGHKESDVTEWLSTAQHNTQLIYNVVPIFAARQSDSVMRIFLKNYFKSYSFPL